MKHKILIYFCLFMGLVFSLQSSVCYAQSTSAAPNVSDITIINNAGISDLIYVGGLVGGDRVKVYNAATGGKLIISAYISQSKSEVQLTVSQLGTASGSVYISVISIGEAESERTKVNYSAEPKSTAPSENNISVSNNAGKSDVVTITDYSDGEKIKVYNSLTDGKLIGSTVASAYKAEVTISVAQLGTSAGSIYVSVTAKGELESSRTKVDYLEEDKTESPNADNIVITNNAGTSDTVYISGLYGGELVKLYNALSGGKLIGSMSIPVSKTDGTMTVNQFGTSAGSIYVSLTNKNERESDRVKINYLEEPKSDPISSSNILITNKAGVSDVVQASCLSPGDIVKVYDLPKGGSLLGSGTVIYSRTDLSISIPQLGNSAGSVYVSILSKKKLESDRTKVDYTAELKSDSLDVNNITITNNGGVADKVEIEGLTTGDIVKIYKNESDNTLLGSATVSTSSTELNISIAQLGTDKGSIYLTLTNLGKYESNRVKVDYDAEPKSDSLAADNVIITNNTSKSDTIKVNGLTGGCVIKVYEAETGSKTLGSTTTLPNATEATVSIAQLGTSAGIIYVSRTNKGELESSRLKVYYNAEEITDIPYTSNVSIINNPSKISDTITISNLESGDLVKVYNSQSDGVTLGSAYVPLTKTETVVNIKQLGSTEGYIFVSVTNNNKLESERLKVGYLGELKSSSINPDNVLVSNKSGIADTIQVLGLTPEDIVNIYDSMYGGKLLGSAKVASDNTYILIDIQQLGKESGNIYLTVTSPNKCESDRIKVEYDSEPVSENINIDNITVINNSGTSDIVKVSSLDVGDLVKIYDSSQGGKLLASSTVLTGSSASISISQLGVKAGTIYVSVVCKDKIESGRLKLDYLEEAKSDTVSKEDVTIVNNAGKSDIVKVNNLTSGDIVNVYDSSKVKTVIGSATVLGYDSSVSISIAQLGVTAGNVYITVTSLCKRESDQLKLDFEAEPKSDVLSTDNISIDNNSGISDLIKVVNLDSGDIVNVYRLASGDDLIASGTVTKDNTTINIIVSQLGELSGNVYMSVVKSGKHESDRIKADYSEEPESNISNSNNILIINNAGAADVVQINGLQGGDVVNVCNLNKNNNLLGSATVGTYDSSASINITQLGSTAGSVYISVINKGKRESKKILVPFAAEQKSEYPLISDITITNNAGINDTIEINFLTKDDCIKVYDSATGGKLLGSATVESDSTTGTVKLSQLGTAAGSVYISITNTNKLESDRIEVSYTEEITSAAPEISNIKVINNASIADTITVYFLNIGDVVKVYSASVKGSLLGSTVVPEDKTQVTISITQIGTTEGCIYVSVTNAGKKESSRTKAVYSEEQKAAAPTAGNITIKNNAGNTDLISVVGLNAGDIVKVYDPDKTSLLGSAVVKEDETEVSVKISQLGTLAGYVYVSITGNGKTESDQTMAYYTSEPVSYAPDVNNVTINNYSGKSDTIKVISLQENDIVKVYDSASSGRLLGYATVSLDETEATVKVSQLGSGSGSVYISVTTEGALESDRTRAYYITE